MIKSQSRTRFRIEVYAGAIDAGYGGKRAGRPLISSHAKKTPYHRLSISKRSKAPWKVPTVYTGVSRNVRPCLTVLVPPFPKQGPQNGIRGPQVSNGPAKALAGPRPRKQAGQTSECPLGLAGSLVASSRPMWGPLSVISRVRPIAGSVAVALWVPATSASRPALEGGAFWASTLTGPPPVSPPGPALCAKRL